MLLQDCMAAALDDPDFLVRSSEVVQSHGLISKGSQPQAFSIWNMQQSQDDRTFSLKMVSNPIRSEEHTSELQSPVPISYAVFCLKKKKKNNQTHTKQKHPDTPNTKTSTT